jgi:F-type H+-transporting ATPase subunit gamma
MAGSKELKARIKSVKNTRKITKTMEMVSTAKSRKMMNLVNAAKPYSEKLVEIMHRLSSQGAVIDSPFLRRVEHPRKVVLLVITANRGLCGGYNSNVVKLARNQMKHYRDLGIETELHVIGKKGINFFKFQKVAMDASHLSKEDAVKFEDTLTFSEDYMHRFAAGEVDRVEVISTVYYNSASQKPEVTVVLPAGGELHGKGHGSEPKAPTGPVIYDPTPDVILTRLVPHLIKSNMYRIFLEAAASEQIYRRIAMKSATDAATDMGKLLNRTYNRIRQASITQEIGEIVAGAEAVQ